MSIRKKIIKFPNEIVTEKSAEYISLISIKVIKSCTTEKRSVGWNEFFVYDRQTSHSTNYNV